MTTSPSRRPRWLSSRPMTGELWVSFNARVLDYLKSVSLRDLMTQAQAQGVVAAPEQSAAAPRKALGWCL